MQKTGDQLFGWEWVCLDLQVNMVKIKDLFPAYNKGPHQLEQG